VVSNKDQVISAGLDDAKGGVDLQNAPPFLRHHSFQRLLEGYLGAPLTYPTLSNIQVEIKKYSQAHDHLIVDVISPEQDIKNDTVQIAVYEGKLDNIAISKERHKWFSDSIIQHGVRLKPGDAVLESRLVSDMDWLNRNAYQSLGYDGFTAPFLDVSPVFQRGTNLGGTDLTLEVKDRFPLRPFAGYEDSGIDVIGKDRLFAGLNWANAFGLDHRLNYQYITDIDFDKFKEHVASYVAPLPWRHELTFFGTYADLNPDFTPINPNLTNLVNQGSFFQLSARYSVPLPQVGDFSHEVTAGFDFKRTDTPLLFESGGSGTPITANKIDIAQFMLAYSARLIDSLGVTAISLQGYYSPGDLTDLNKDAAFVDFSQNTNAQANYVYGRGELRRSTSLPFNLTWYLRAAGQYSDSTLVATEVFGLGGYDTVRGYDERIVSGDHGWLLINELRSPKIPLVGLFRGKLQNIDWIQALAFCDYGGTINRDHLEGHQDEILLSVGAGLRYQFRDNLRVRFDYGYQLDRDYLNGNTSANLVNSSRGRTHVGVELSF
jgi:hemolysin activation/secretion protein